MFNDPMPALTQSVLTPAALRARIEALEAEQRRLHERKPRTWREQWAKNAMDLRELRTAYAVVAARAVAR